MLDTINLARQLLLDQGKRGLAMVGDIAQQLGFSSRSYFPKRYEQPCDKRLIDTLNISQLLKHQLWRGKRTFRRRWQARHPLGTLDSMVSIPLRGIAGRSARAKLAAPAANLGGGLSPPCWRR